MKIEYKGSLDQDLSPGERLMADMERRKARAAIVKNAVARIGKGMWKNFTNAWDEAHVHGKDLSLDLNPKQYIDKSDPEYTASIWSEPNLPLTVGEVFPKRIKLKIPRKYAGSINLDKQKISEELKNLERVLAGKLPEKKVQTWDETGSLAIDMMNDYKKQISVLNKAKKGEGLNTVEGEVLRRTNINAIHKLKELATDPNITEAARGKLFASFQEDVFKAANAGPSEAGRLLNVFKKELAYTRLSKNLSELEKGLKPHQWEQFKKINIENPFEVKRFADSLKDPKTIDYLYEFWYNNILSGIPTHVINVASNTAWMAFQLPHRALTSAVDKTIHAFRGGERTRFLNETVPMMAGIKSGAKRGIKAAKDVFTKGELADFETKWAQEVGSAQGAFERSPNAFLRGIGKYLTVPTKGLRAMDVMGNSMAYDAQLKALARRTANLKKIPKDKYRDFAKQFTEHPPDWAHKDAMEFAQYSTFMSEPGKISQGIMQIREAPGVRFVIPFVNTIGNLLKRGTEMTPGLGLVLAKGQNPAEVIAKQIEGGILTYLVWDKIAKGEIIGEAPKRPAERERFYAQGKKEWSVKVGDNYFQFRRVEPFNTVIASAKIYHDMFEQLPTEEEKEKVFMEAANSFKNNLLDSSYLQGVSQILNRNNEFGRILPNVTSGFVPYSGFWRSVNRSYEAATEGSAKVRDTQGWLGTFGQVLPGLSSKSPAKLNVWGEEINFEGGVFRQWLPYKWAKETNDVVEMEFARLNQNPDIDIYPGLPNKTITDRGKKVTLPDDLYREYAISFGHAAYKKVLETIQGSDYQKLTDEQKVKRLAHRLSSVRATKLTQVKQRYRGGHTITFIGEQEQEQ